MKKIFVCFLLLFLLFLSGCGTNITSLSLSKDSISLGIGESEALGALYEPADVNPKLVWSSSNPSVASVNNGVVFGVSKGTAIITIKYGDFTDTCTVQVINIQEQLGQVLDDLESASLLLNEVADSLIAAWHYGIFESSDYGGQSVVIRLYEITGAKITSYSQLVDAYNDAYGTNYTATTVGSMLEDDFSRCVNTVKQAYINLASYSSAMTKINHAKSLLQSLDSSTEGYSEFQSLYLKVKSYYDALYTPSGNYTQFSTNIRTIEGDITNLINTAEFFSD